MKKDTILILIAVAAILALVLPKQQDDYSSYNSNSSGYLFDS